MTLVEQLRERADFNMSFQCQAQGQNCLELLHAHGAEEGALGCTHSSEVPTQHPQRGDPGLLTVDWSC